MKVIINEKEYDLPEITVFRASTGTAHNRQPFSLEWEVTNATHLELNKNGIPFERLSADQRSRQVSETYDGREKEIEYTLTAWNDAVRVLSPPVYVRITDGPSQGTVPEILFFRSEAERVQSRKPFLLEWEVRNASQVDLHRNGIVFARLDAEKKSREITETYDGRDKEIVYTLTAINPAGKRESDPVQVTVTNGIDAWSSPDLADETISHDYIMRRENNLKKIRMYLFGLLAVVIVVLGCVLYYFLNKPRILDFDPKTIVEEHTVVITGKNFPTDSAAVQVLFNKVKGRIQYLSGQIMRVNVPNLGESVGDGNVTIALVVKGDTTYGKNKLVVTKRQQDIPVPNLADPSARPTAPEPTRPSNQNLPVVRVDSPQAPTGRRPKSINIYNFVKASRNFKGNASGGTDLRITVQNSSPFDLDNVHVEVSYFKRNQADIKKETLVFPNIRAHLEMSKDILDGTPGTPVTFKILLIKSRQLDKYLQG